MGAPVGPLLTRLAARDRLSPEEVDAVNTLIAREVVHPAGAIIVPEGELQSVSQLLLAGTAARSKSLVDGRRQITELHVAGDFIDLHSFLLKRLEHDVVALSPVRMGIVPHERLKTITEQFPHLTRMLWLTTLIDAAIHREWIVSAGRRSALQQVACLFCELLTRYQIAGLTEDDSFPLPVTQAHLADACGLTSVHLNRVLQTLRGDGLIAWSGGDVRIGDPARLAAVGGFDPAYLILDKTPR